MKNIIILNVLGAVFLLSVGGVYLLLSSGESEAVQQQPAAVVVERPQQIRMVDVLVPVRMVDQGEQLQPTMFKHEPRPESSVSERIIRDFNEVQGSYARSVIMPGEPLNRDYLTGAKPTSPVLNNIPEGYRAVTINVNVISGVEGWARPGARVDVSWISSVLGKPTLSLIVQNALVLSAERNPNPNAEPGAPVPATLTLLVSAKDAAKIQLASTTGQLTLSLRGSTDHGRGTTFSDITIYDIPGGGKNDDGTGDNVEGFVRYNSGDGKTEEMVIMNGQVIRKSGKQ
jgi:pilus assembly protein CpaB